MIALVLGILLLYALGTAAEAWVRLWDTRRELDRANLRAAVAERRYDSLQNEWADATNELAKTLDRSIRFGPAIEAARRRNALPRKGTA